VRRWAAASLIVVAALHGRVTGQWAIALFAAAAVLAALAWGARLALSRNGARVLAAVAAAGGAAAGAVFVPAAGEPLRPPWPALALAGLLAGAALLCRREGEGRSAAILVPGLIALTACGEAPLGLLYALVAVLHIALSLTALRAGDVGRKAHGRTSRRRLAVGAGLLGLASAVAGGFVLGLPPLSRWTEGRILHALGGAESGFSDRLWLGSLDGMLQSDEVVMRLDGPRADYLRGAVYDHYEIGRWGRLRPARPEPVSTTGRATAGADRVHLHVVAGTRDRYFLPLGASDVSTAEPGAADRFGVLRVLGGVAHEVSFREGGPPDFPVAPPGEDDLGLPPELRGPLERIARSWTEGAASPEARVEAIAERLRTTFVYSLTFEHARRRDPLLDFLLDDHKGQCEYFASAMTLLARAAGVPARVAIGYRVAEENTLGGYWVVRERNAHAWSEAFLPGRGFVTVDATPAGAVAGNAPHAGSFLGSLVDVLGSAWSRATSDLGIEHVVGALLAVIAVGWLLRRWQQRRSPPATRAWRATVERPPPSVTRLLEALTRRGAVRPAWEPLERFAVRLEGPELAAPAQLLLRWAAHRYGGEGDAETLLRELDACAEQLQQRS